MTIPLQKLQREIPHKHYLNTQLSPMSIHGLVYSLVSFPLYKPRLRLLVLNLLLLPPPLLKLPEPLLAQGLHFCLFLGTLLTSLNDFLWCLCISTLLRHSPIGDTYRFERLDRAEQRVQARLGYIRQLSHVRQ